jgi:HEAT repeat protein
MNHINKTLPVLASALLLAPLPARPFRAAPGNKAAQPLLTVPLEDDARQEEAETLAQKAGNPQMEPMELAQKAREQELYDRGTEAMDKSRWEKAVEAFGSVASLKGSRADGALYWKAYALNKLTRRADALATLGELQKTYPNSRWMNDAKALELEVRQATGKPVSPESESDEDLKLIALNGLMNSEPERALPILQKLLQGNQSPRIKEHALFVLSQSASPQAHELLAQIARGKSNPDLQMKAIQSLGVFGSQESRQLLADIYASSSDIEVKRAVLGSFMVGGERDRLLTAAKSEKNPELRKEAIRQLGLTGADSELWQLYQAEPQLEVKEEILRSMFIGGKAERLLDVARNEKEVRLRRAAVQSLGLMGAERTGEALGSLYGTEKDPEVRRAILNAFFIQGNAKALIAIARSEKDMEMKKEVVSKLALMESKEAKDYMLELLSK